jgi:hypothetical protein
MSEYSNEIVVPAPKERVINLVSDPFFFSGVFGHINILRAYDASLGKYVELHELSGRSNKFMVIYIFGTPETKINLFKGEMEGPIYAGSGVIYRGWTDDRRFNAEAKFEVNEVKGGVSELKIKMNAEYKISGLDRLLGRTAFMLAHHVIEEHIIPYFKNYFKTEKKFGLEGIAPTKIMEEQGPFSQIWTKIVNAIGNLEYGVITIEGENIDGRIIVKDGKVSKTVVKNDNKVSEGQDAVFELMSTTKPLRVSLYSVDLDDILMTKPIK